jgi:hypothetical protein
LAIGKPVARIHLDDHQPPICGIDRELHVGAAGLDPDLAQHRNRGVAHDLVFLVGERERGRDRDRVAGVHAHRIEVLDRADDDAVVALVAHHLHLELFPPQHRFLDQHLVGGRGVDATLDDVDEFRLGVGDAAAGAAERERGADDGGQADLLERGERVDQRLDLLGTRRLEPDAVHRLAKKLAILGHVDGLRRGADHRDVEARQHPHSVERQRGVERGLPAHGGQQAESARNDMAFLLDDLGDDLGRDRLDIGGVGEIGVGHDRRRIGVDQDDPIALGFERLDRLRAGIVELTGLPDDDRPCADDQDRGDVGPFGHVARRYVGTVQAQKKGAPSARPSGGAEVASPRAAAV